VVVKPQPVIELSRFILEALWKDEEFILYRGRGESDASQVLVLSPGVEYPTPGEWETQRRIDEFPLSEHDTPDRLLIPEKLYGRAHEIDTLLASFDRVVASGTPELVLVSGYSGIGKSSVVNELHKVLVLPRGLLASGKFDQHKRDIPYATLAQAFQGLVRQILSKSEQEVGHWGGTQSGRRLEKMGS